MTMEAIRISLYVHKDFQGQGIEAHAKKLGLTHICTDASLLASPFFERKGYLNHANTNSRATGHIVNDFSMVKIFIDEKDG